MFLLKQLAKESWLPDFEGRRAKKKCAAEVPAVHVPHSSVGPAGTMPGVLHSAGGTTGFQDPDS